MKNIICKHFIIKIFLLLTTIAYIPEAKSQTYRYKLEEVNYTDGGKE